MLPHGIPDVSLFFIKVFSFSHIGLPQKQAVFFVLSHIGTAQKQTVFYSLTHRHGTETDRFLFSNTSAQHRNRLFSFSNRSTHRHKIKIEIYR